MAISPTQGSSSAAGQEPVGNIYAAIAKALGDSSATNHKLEGQDDQDKRMEQSIVSALQNINSNAKDSNAALAQVKRFLETMLNATSDWGPEIKGWIQGELDKANSYSPSQDLLDKLQKDEATLSHDLQGLQNVENDLNKNEEMQTKDQEQLHNLQTRLDYYEKHIKSVPFGEQIRYAFEIAGIAIQIAPVSISLGTAQVLIKYDQPAVDGAQGTVDNDQKQIDQDKAAITHDPAIKATLSKIAQSADATNSKLKQFIAQDAATKERANGFDKQISEIKIGKTFDGS